MANNLPQLPSAEPVMQVLPPLMAPTQPPSAEPFMQVSPPPPMTPAQPASSGASLNPIVDAASKLGTLSGNMANSQQQNNSATLLVPQANQEDTNTGLEGLLPSTQAAQKALTAPAQYEQQQGVQQGQLTQNQGNQISQQGAIQQQKNYDAQNNALVESNKAILNAEGAMNNAADLAKIDPTNYLTQLGVSGRTITALGMMVSGAGAGLTGQPNMAYDFLNKSIQRDIDAQKQSFMNTYQVAQGQLGIVHTQQQQQIISAQAGAAAAMTVATGANVAYQGLMAKIKANYAPAQAAQVQNFLQQTLVKSQADINRLYGISVSDNNLLQLNANGILYNNAIADKLGQGKFQVPTSPLRGLGGPPMGQQPPQDGTPTQSMSEMFSSDNPTPEVQSIKELPNYYGVKPGESSLLDALAAKHK